MIPKWQSDLADIVNIGNDLNAYWNMHELLRSIEGNEDMASTQFFNAIDLIARVTRKLENKS